MSYSIQRIPTDSENMTPPETSSPATPIPAAEMIHETLRAWRSEHEEREQVWWRRMWRRIFPVNE